MTRLMLYENAFLATILAIAAIFFVWRKFFATEPLSLVAGWNTLHKRWSTWFAVVGACLLAAPELVAHGLGVAWDALSPDMRGAIPPQVVQGIGCAVMVCKFAAAVIQQRKLVAIARPAGPLAIAPQFPPARTYDAVSAVSVQVEQASDVPNGAPGQ